MYAPCAQAAGLAERLVGVPEEPSRAGARTLVARRCVARRAREAEHACHRALPLEGTAIAESDAATCTSRKRLGHRGTGQEWRKDREQQPAGTENVASPPHFHAFVNNIEAIDH